VAFKLILRPESGGKNGNENEHSFLRQKPKKATEQTPIYMRVTIDGKRLEVSANHAVELSRWTTGAGKVKGNSEQARTINAHLDVLKRRAQDYQQEILMEGSPLTIELFKVKWFGLGEVQYTLMQVIREHNNKLEQLIGKGYERATCVKYRTTEKHVGDFIRWKYKIVDLNLKALKYEFIVDLEFYLKSQKNLSVNSYGKIIKNIKKSSTNASQRTGWTKIHLSFTK
jgi:hypothetical protein